MKAFIVLCIVVGSIIAATPEKIDDAVFRAELNAGRPEVLMSDRVMIAQIGGTHSLGGSQGKSIVVSDGGEAIAVIFGAPVSGPGSDVQVKVAYSTNDGVTWIKYGPFSPPLHSLQNDVAGTPYFYTNPGELWFVWQESTPGYNAVQINVMIEENIPSAPSFSVPIIPTNAMAPVIYPWEPSIAVMQDDPTYLVVTAWSYLTGGNEWAYCWVSSDGGYTWTDTIPMAFVSADGASGALAAGTNGYLCYSYLDYYTFSGIDSTPYPYYMESTDGGYTWSAETPITVFPVNAASQYWWSEFDCIVINNEPWVVFNDIGTGGTGGPHVAKATGSPGNWTWTIWDAGVLGHDSTWYGDTLWYCEPSQYPSLSYDQASGTILASYKSNIYVGNGVNWAMFDGPHIQGIFKWDGDSTWYITMPLSTANTGEILWDDWSATETADWLVNTSAHSKNYSIWVLENPSTGAGELYFESEVFGDYTFGWPTAVSENTSSYVCAYGFILRPSVTSSTCRANVTMPAAEEVSLRIYDVTGRLIEEVFNGHLTNGTYKLDINARRLVTGTYFAVLKTNVGQQVEKFIVAR